MSDSKQSPRRIAVLTSSRADFSHLFWPLRALEEHPAIELRLIALGSHLSPEFGTTIKDIERQGFTVDERVECLLSSDADTGMARTIGLATLSLTDVLDRLRPDVLLLIADRYELLAAAAAALSLRVPIAHIEGGEISEGAIDDAVRNALTKMSHLHFTPTEKARQRVLAMGEEPWRVHKTGAPSLDHLVKCCLPTRQDLNKQLKTRLEPPFAVVACHPVTLLEDTVAEADAVFDALARLECGLVFCFPNSDAGSRKLIRRARDFCGKHSQAQLFVNLRPETYLGLLNEAAVMIGNSSSGIMETPSLALPTVNIGFRQEGRERARNIIDVAADRDAIVAAVRRALNPAFRRSLEGMENPYGDGHSAERIVETLATCPLGEALLIKRALPVTATSAGPAFDHGVPDTARRA